MMLAVGHVMNDRLEPLCAELRAIDYFEWHYRHPTHPSDSDELSHQLRLERRQRIVTEIQVIFASLGRPPGRPLRQHHEETPQADSNCSS